MVLITAVKRSLDPPSGDHDPRAENGVDRDPQVENHWCRPSQLLPFVVISPMVSLTFHIQFITNPNSSTSLSPVASSSPTVAKGLRPIRLPPVVLSVPSSCITSNLTCVCDFHLRYTFSSRKYSPSYHPPFLLLSPTSHVQLTVQHYRLS